MGRRTFGSIRKLPSGRWQASYVDSIGARVVAPTTFSTKADASAWLSLVEADRSRGELLDPRLSTRTFAGWANDWLTSLHVRPSTHQGYESALGNHVMPVFGDRPIASIRYRDCKHSSTRSSRKGSRPAPSEIGRAHV